MLGIKPTPYEQIEILKELRNHYKQLFEENKNVVPDTMLNILENRIVSLNSGIEALSQEWEI